MKLNRASTHSESHVLPPLPSYFTCDKLESHFVAFDFQKRKQPSLFLEQSVPDLSDNHREAIITKMTPIKPLSLTRTITYRHRAAQARPRVGHAGIGSPGAPALLRRSRTRLIHSTGLICGRQDGLVFQTDSRESLLRGRVGRHSSHSLSASTRFARLPLRWGALSHSFVSRRESEATNLLAPLALQLAHLA